MSSHPIRVALIGATGRSGGNIVSGLLESPGKFQVTAFVRPSSAAKPEVAALEAQGVKVAVVDLRGGRKDLVQALQGIDVVISAVVVVADHADQIALVDAAKEAGVKRFVPSSWQPMMPPRGVLDMRAWKEDINDHIKRAHLGYTIIDVGWWYQVMAPTLPSGRLGTTFLPNGGFGGSLPSAAIDARNIGRYVARIIADPRTLNKHVFAYDDVATPNDVHAMIERVSGEKYDQPDLTKEQLEEAIEKARQALAADPDNFMNVMILGLHQYNLSISHRGDNTPENAAYLGYLDCRELYPDLKRESIEAWFTRVLENKGEGVLP